MANRRFHLQYMLYLPYWVNGAACGSDVLDQLRKLWATAQAVRLPERGLATYRQWAELGAQVRKGERCSPVVFWKISDKETQDGDEDGVEDNRQSRVFARDYSVFNAAQVDGYPAPALLVLPEAERIDHAETFFAATGIEVRHGDARAHYRPARTGCRCRPPRRSRMRWPTMPP